MTRLFKRDEVGMVAPPPLVYAAPLVAAALAQRFVVRLPIGGAEWARTRTGVATILIAAGLGLALPAVAWFVRRGTPVIPLRPTTALVRSGPYRFTRNPMYVGLTLVSAGLGFLMNTWWALIFLPVAVAVIDRGVIAPEERYMRERFGAEYDAFTRKVRRWI